MALRRYTLVLFDVVALLLLWLVIQDEGIRESYATNQLLLNPSTAYTLFTKTFTMTGVGAPLVSPLTLDWVQVLVAALFLVNLWGVYSGLKYRRAGKAGDN